MTGGLSEQEKERQRDAWDRARCLRRALVEGDPLPEAPFVPVRLEPNETAYAQVDLDYARWLGARVSYQQNSTGFYGSPGFVAAGMLGQAVGNAAARSSAQRQAAPQWRGIQRLPAYLTSKRILALVNRNQWTSIYHAAVVQIHLELEQWAFVQTGQQDSAPVRWSGPSAPWLAVAVTYLSFGVEHLIHRPEFAVFGPLEPEPGGEPAEGEAPMP